MSDMVNTNELRFVLRYVDMPGKPGVATGVRILQQRWVRIGTMRSEELTAENSEWRDVPLVEGL